MRQRVVEVADPYNSPHPEIPRRSTKLAAINQLLGTFARKLASLKQYGLVRLASQAVPSLVYVGLSNTAARLLEV